MAQQTETAERFHPSLPSFPMSNDFDPWLDAVLKSNKRPAWLLGDAPHHDVVVSSRVRLARSLSGYPFPKRATRKQLEEIREKVVEAAVGFEERRLLSEAERAVLVGSRLISPDFEVNAPGRCVLLSPKRDLAIMVNEEDHLRVQAVSAGLSLETAANYAGALDETLKPRLTFSKDDEFGYLNTSIINLGEGKRIGAMLHLPALTAEGYVEEILNSLEAKGIGARGLFGESTEGVAGFLQVSTTQQEFGIYRDQILVLMDSEREARNRLDPENVETSVAGITALIEAPEGLSQKNAIRCIGWLRLAALRGLVNDDPRRLDALLSLVCFGAQDEEATNRRRSNLIKRFRTLALEWAAN